MNIFVYQMEPVLCTEFNNCTFIFLIPRDFCHYALKTPLFYGLAYRIIFVELN